MIRLQELIGDQAGGKQSRRELQTELENSLKRDFRAIIGIIPPTSDSLARLDQLLQDDRLKRLEELLDVMKVWDAPNTIPEPKSFLYYSHLQSMLVQMLKNIAKYREYLKRFVDRFHAENENTAPKRTKKRKKQNDDRQQSDETEDEVFFADAAMELYPKLSSKPGAPIHYAVLQLDQDFLDWLLDHPNIDVNLRNSFQPTALTLLCEMYDQCMRKEDKKSRLKSEKNALAKIETLIVRLLKAGADFNICFFNKQLAFELLHKHIKHNRTKIFIEQCLPHIPSALVICTVNDNKKRVVEFYKHPRTEEGKEEEEEKKNLPINVTVELLEIFLRYNDCANFTTYMRTFVVNETNVKKVIRLLLHTACDQKLTDCVRLIVDRGEQYIFQGARRNLVRAASSHAQTEPSTSSLETNRRYSSQESSEIPKGSELRHRVELKGLLKKVCLMANEKLLKRILPMITDRVLLNLDPLLLITLDRAHKFRHRIVDRDAFLACAEYLLVRKTISKSKLDDSGNTSLHLALKYGFDSVALALLRQGHTYLGMCNKDNQTPLECAPYKFWKKYLDQCITVDLKRAIPDRDEIRFNLNGFYAPLQDKAFQAITNSTVNADGLVSSSKSRKQHRSWKLIQRVDEKITQPLTYTSGKMLLFILFMFFAPIVILNLINGLAVSDIAAIREESELISISKKVMLLEQYERGAANVYPAWLKRCFPKPFFSEYQYSIHVKTKEFCKIDVTPKGLTKPKTKERENHPQNSIISFIRNLFSCCFQNETTNFEHSEDTPPGLSVAPDDVQNSTNRNQNTPGTSQQPSDIPQESNVAQTKSHEVVNAEQECLIQMTPVTLEHPTNGSPMVPDGLQNIVHNKMKKKTSKVTRALPKFYWILPNVSCNYVVNLYYIRLPLFVSLDQAILNQALAIIERQQTISFDASNISVNRGSHIQVEQEEVRRQAKGRALLRQERKTLETFFEQQFKATIGIIPPTGDSLARLDQLLQDDRLKRLEELIDFMKVWDAPNTIPEPKSFLHYARLQPVFVQMLEKIEQHREYLEQFIVRFQAENESTALKYNPQSKSDVTKPSAPIHYAVLQRNSAFLDWLLARPNTDVNIRNSFKQTALTLLCENYDQCMRKSKQACPTGWLEEIRTLIKRLLEAGADFNICSIHMKLPFELLLKHCSDEETQSFVEQCIQCVPGALAICRTNDSNERVVGFYNNNPRVEVTVELLEIFLRYSDRTNFMVHMEKFVVNETNVKKVIRLLLHTACDQNLNDCVRLIVDRGEQYIFKVVQRKAIRVASNLAQLPPSTSSVELNREYSRLESTELPKGSELEHRVELKGLLKKVCLMADLPMLQRLLAKISDLIVLNDDPLLVVTLNRAYDSKRRPFFSEYQCRIHIKTKEYRKIVVHAKVKSKHPPKGPQGPSAASNNTAQGTGKNRLHGSSQCSVQITPACNSARQKVLEKSLAKFPWLLTSESCNYVFDVRVFRLALFMRQEQAIVDEALAIIEKQQAIASTIAAKSTPTTETPVAPISSIVATAGRQQRALSPGPSRAKRFDMQPVQGKESVQQQLTEVKMQLKMVLELLRRKEQLEKRKEKQLGRDKGIKRRAKKRNRKGLKKAATELGDQDIR
uniref:Uncharacterized protein n=1 Tax=Anopheles culicifacies TaxID=139723 RepID=A0A182MPP8_9DIPT